MCVYSFFVIEAWDESYQNLQQGTFTYGQMARVQGDHANRLFTPLLPKVFLFIISLGTTRPPYNFCRDRITKLIFWLIVVIKYKKIYFSNFVGLRPGIAMLKYIIKIKKISFMKKSYIQYFSYLLVLIVAYQNTYFRSYILVILAMASLPAYVSKTKFISTILGEVN